MAYGKSKPKIKNMPSRKKKASAKKKAPAKKGKGGLTKAQQKLPAFLKKKILNSKKA